MTALPNGNGNGAFEHEELAVRRGPRSGATIAVAIHSTQLGPALGGLRFWRYEAHGDAVADVLRLSRGMTLKASAAGLDLGGGKGVICPPSGEGSRSPVLRREMLLDFADLVASLEGRYITAEDVGVGSGDMTTISERTEHVVGLPLEAGGVGDPSPFTAIGVEAGIRACVEHRRGDRDLRGLEVSVVGLGHVGGRLAMRLANAGARLTVSDVDPLKRALAERLDARWVDPEVALVGECDVLAPCALGGVISEATVDAIGASIICGAANNQLADDSLADRLSERGILYGPDFIANAGGLMSCVREINGYDEGWTHDKALGIETTMGEILASAAGGGLTPLAAARRLAGERLAGGAVPNST